MISKQRYRILKLIALLSLIRWYNLALTLFAQYLAAIFVLTPNRPILDILKDGKLHLFTLSTLFIVSAGFIINGFYDYEKDLINKPNKTFFGRGISQTSGFRLYIFLNIFGFITAFLASFNILLFFICFAFGMWFYSHKLQKIPIIRELSASMLSVAAFLGIGIYYQFITIPLFVYGLFAMLLIFAREIIKGIENYKGDAIYGYHTLVVKLGKINASALVCLINGLAMFILMYFYMNYTFPYGSIFIFLICGLIIYNSILILQVGKISKIHEAHFLMKLIIILVIIGVIGV